MIPDYQSLMRPVLELCAGREVSTAEAIERLSREFHLTKAALDELLPSGKQTIFANRVHWAKTYLNQAGLIEYTRRGHFRISPAGEKILDSNSKIDSRLLRQFPSFVEFQSRRRKHDPSPSDLAAEDKAESQATPDEVIRSSYERVNVALAFELLDRVINADPAFFEMVIVDLLLAMGYGGASDENGRTLGRSGDDGVDGVIDQDALGIDQIYLQAKRYRAGNNISAGAIRDFHGALSLKRAQKGIFVTTSAFSEAAIRTAHEIGSRIVLIDGPQLSRLMIRYGIGCRDEQVLHLKKVDVDYFEPQSG